MPEDRAMPATTKIATCCYCGTRAALVLNENGRHELACSSCGAPLHDLKMLRQDTPRGIGKPAPVKAKRAKPGPMARGKPVRKNKPKGRKPRRGLMSKLMDEAWDAIEDLLD